MGCEHSYRSGFEKSKTLLHHEVSLCLDRAIGMADKNMDDQKEYWRQVGRQDSLLYILKYLNVIKVNL